MAEELTLNFTVPSDDFTRAGEASSATKSTLKQLGLPADIIRRVSIVMYEGEINMVIHAKGGEITVTVAPDHITMVLKDVGPGIPDVEKAMQAGWSTARFGLWRWYGSAQHEALRRHAGHRHHCRCRHHRHCGHPLLSSFPERSDPYGAVFPLRLFG